MPCASYLPTPDMDLQPTLFDDLLLAPTVEPAPPADGRRLSIAERFAAFHEANPHVYAGIRKLAVQMKRAGHRKWSTKAAFEVMRWQWAIRTNDAGSFKLNNIYTSRYARLLMANEPELAGFFETREKAS